MKRFKNILVVVEPYADKDAALDRAMQLARNNKARVTIVSVLREVERALPNIQKAVHRQQSERLKALAGTVARKGDRITCRALIGIPFIEIIKEVVRGEHDLLIKSAEGRGGVTRWLFGNTDWHLLRKCPCPVWIGKVSKRKKLSRVLAAVDLDPGVETNAELNALIMDLASSISRQEGSELHVVHAWTVPHEKTIRAHSSVMSKSEADKLARDLKNAHARWLDELVSRYDLGDIRHRIHLPKGDAAALIPSVANKVRAELVVMGTLARTGIPGFVIGNTAEKILAELDCSVLAVKPKSFSTPVAGR